MRWKEKRCERCLSRPIDNQTLAEIYRAFDALKQVRGSR